MLKRSTAFRYGLVSYAEHSSYGLRVPMLIPFTRAKDVRSLGKYATHI